MRNKRCFEIIVFAIIHLTVGRARIKREKDFSESKEVEIVIHMGYGAAVAQCHFVKLTVIDAKA